MRTDPLVSVIIPTFNRSVFLTETIDSVLNQTYSPIELIIVDDGSTDNTYKIIKKYLSDNRFRYIFSPKNNGVSWGRNIGIQNATGDYISFLDSDDSWVKDKLRIQMSFLLSQNDFQVCYTDEIWIRKGVRVNQKKKHRKYSGFIYPQCLPLCIISPSSIVLERQVMDEIGLFDETLPACEDYDYWLRLSAQYPIYFMEDYLIIKKGGHPDQLSHKYLAMDQFRIKAMLKMIDSGKLSEEYYLQTVEMIIEKSEILKKGYYKHGNRIEGDYYSSLIEKFNP